MLYTIILIIAAMTSGWGVSARPASSWRGPLLVLLWPGRVWARNEFWFTSRGSEVVRFTPVGQPVVINKWYTGDAVGGEDYTQPVTR